jgi:hypothetical protein
VHGIFLMCTANMLFAPEFITSLRSMWVRPHPDLDWGTCLYRRALSVGWLPVLRMSTAIARWYGGAATSSRVNHGAVSRGTEAALKSIEGLLEKACSAKRPDTGLIARAITQSMQC